MADTTGKANKRQSGKASRKVKFQLNWERSKKNKIRRMRTTLKRQPTNMELAKRLDWWVKEGYTRRGTKANHAGRK